MKAPHLHNSFFDVIVALEIYFIPSRERYLYTFEWKSTKHSDRTILFQLMNDKNIDS